METDSELKLFREDMDAWIKQIRGEVSQLSELPEVIDEHAETIEHNYELIQELKKEVQELKQQLKIQQLMQIAILERKTMLQH